MLACKRAYYRHAYGTARIRVSTRRGTAPRLTLQFSFASTGQAVPKFSLKLMAALRGCALLLWLSGALGSGCTSQATIGACLTASRLEYQAAAKVLGVDAPNHRRCVWAFNKRSGKEECRQCGNAYGPLVTHKGEARGLTTVAYWPEGLLRAKDYPMKGMKTTEEKDAFAGDPEQSLVAKVHFGDDERWDGADYTSSDDLSAQGAGLSLIHI